MGTLRLKTGTSLPEEGTRDAVYLSILADAAAYLLDDIVPQGPLMKELVALVRRIAQYDDSWEPC